MPAFDLTVEKTSKPAPGLSERHINRRVEVAIGELKSICTEMEAELGALEKARSEGLAALLAALGIGIAGFSLSLATAQTYAPNAISADTGIGISILMFGLFSVALSASVVFVHFRNQRRRYRRRLFNLHSKAGLYREVITTLASFFDGLDSRYLEDALVKIYFARADALLSRMKQFG